MEECQRLLSVVSSADHLAFRIFIQLGLRSEELFALRRNDVVEDTLRIDEAIVEGASATVKTEGVRGNGLHSARSADGIPLLAGGRQRGPKSLALAIAEGAALGSAKLLESCFETGCDSRADWPLQKKNSQR